MRCGIVAINQWVILQDTQRLNHRRVFDRHDWCIKMAILLRICIYTHICEYDANVDVWNFHRHDDWVRSLGFSPACVCARASLSLSRDLYKVIFQQESDRNVEGKAAAIANSLVVLCTTYRATRLVQRTCPTISSVTAVSFIKSPFIETNTTIAKRFLVTRSHIFQFFHFFFHLQIL